MSSLTRVGIVAVTMTPATIEQRRRTIADRIAQAADQGCQLVCFPEFVHIQRTCEAVAIVNVDGGEDIYNTTAEPVPDGPTARVVADACRKHAIWAIVGLCQRHPDNTVTNAVVVMDDRGRVVGTHHKTHNAPGEDEEGGIAQGDAIEPIETPFGKVGVITCYEIYFPEIARVYESLDTDWLYYPHADMSENCLLLARARALDSHMPLIMCGYANPENPDNTSTGVAAIDAKGRILACVHGQPTILVVDLDLRQRPQAVRRWNRPDDLVDDRTFRWNRRRAALYRPLIQP